ncbi:MAG: SUMF1/EgtB/PvdO family nonheme iron enzyme [Caldithrix sp.]|nr:SUMF1/EgtB/PvdO family nonheme iron enzyme [Caldithrix sp.]
MVRWIWVLAVISFMISAGFTNDENRLSELKVDTENGLMVKTGKLDNGYAFQLTRDYPLFSVDIGDQTVFSTVGSVFTKNDSIQFILTDAVKGNITLMPDFQPGFKMLVNLYNRSDSMVKVANFVPFGKADDHLYITASGPWSLARTKLFRPQKGAVGVVLPDNAWDLGYGDIKTNTSHSICALSRRTSVKNADRKRWRTEVKPGGMIQFTIWIDAYAGRNWHDGLRLMFQDRFIYDLKGPFDNTLYEREDLSWIRHRYVMNTHIPWDHDFYDIYEGGYKLNAYFDQMERLFGGWDIYVLWPTWPMLGLDQRNQWDLYGDLPGGRGKVRQIAENLHDRDAKLFVSYNPWDQSTRYVDPYEGMTDLIRKTDADGVVLDTYGHSTDSLQMAADKVKKGVVMYSEGMAVPKDMQGIVTGRVHDAIFLPPPLNLNKFIKPDNAFFRVCQLFQGRLHREVGIALFNGYGIEINMIGVGRPAWETEEYRYMGRALRILRENTHNFVSQDWTPLLPTLKDSIWVNRWPEQHKTIYTVFSLRPQGQKGPLFQAPVDRDKHYISLWHHRELKPDTIDGQIYIKAETRAFDRAWLQTRREGNVDVIAWLPRYLKVSLVKDRLTIDAAAGDEIRIWAGHPSYGRQPVVFDTQKRTVNLTEVLGRYEGKVVIQLLDDGILLDERIVELPLQMARRISRVHRTPAAEQKPAQMVHIPAGKIKLTTSKNSVWVVPNPKYPEEGKIVEVESFYMDKYPVTNRQFKAFIDDSGYMPDDTVNFLAHWQNSTYKDTRGKHPVVCVSYEDARAYAKWAGKRLPTEAEWLYAARGDDGRLWPWGAEFDSSRCNVALGHSTPVDAFPSGASPFGVMDLVGNVWQLTNDVYDNATSYYIIMRGGSYYKPTSSWWYVKGGPQPLDRSQILLRVSQGYERNATVGFRCVKDK